MSEFFVWMGQQMQLAAAAPRYIQLATTLEAAIQQRVIAPGAFLPPERSMAEVLSLSRVTVSKAMALLEDKALITRQQGLGTRVCQHLAYPLNKEPGFTAQVVRSGGQVSNRWLQRLRQPATAFVAQMLGLEPNASVTKLRRIRLVDGSPVSVEITYIPERFLPDPEMLEHSLYTLWEARGIFPDGKNFRLKAVASSAEIAELLEISPGEPLLRIRQLSMNAQGEVLEFSEALCRSDVYEFEVDGC